MPFSNTATVTSFGNRAPVTVFGPDFPFAFDEWIRHPAGLGVLPPQHHGAEVAIVGAGMAGIVAAYELMKLGLKPVIYDASKLGGRLRSQAFEAGQGGSPNSAECAFRFPARASTTTSTRWVWRHGRSRIR